MGSKKTLIFLFSIASIFCFSTCIVPAQLGAQTLDDSDEFAPLDSEAPPDAPVTPEAPSAPVGERFPEALAPRERATFESGMDRERSYGMASKAD